MEDVHGREVRAPGTMEDVHGREVRAPGTMEDVHGREVRAPGTMDTAPMSLRLIASDIDGTLLRSDGTMSDRTVRALAAAEEAGVLVVLCTGRPPRWMKPIAEATGHHGIAVCANGALVYDLHTEEVVE